MICLQIKGWIHWGQIIASDVNLKFTFAYFWSVSLLITLISSIGHKDLCFFKVDWLYTNPDQLLLVSRRKHTIILPFYRCPMNDLSIDYFCNKTFLGSLTNLVGIQYMRHTILRNICVCHEAVNLIALNVKWFPQYRSFNFVYIVMLFLYNTRFYLMMFLWFMSSNTT